MTPLDHLAARLEERLGAGRVVRDAAIGTMTTYRVGGVADVFCEPASAAELTAVAEEVAAVRSSSGHVTVLVVGRGSNLLVADEGFDGLAVRLGDPFATIEIDGVSVRAGGAAALPAVARQTAAAGLTGFEWAVGVPGSIGGAVRMNAGGHGSDMASSVRGVSVVDLGTGSEVVLGPADLEFGYRRSSIGPDQIVTEVVLQLEGGDADAAAEEIAAIVRWRRQNQPGGQNAGSVFVNPAGDSAGRLIDVAGCKGLRIGSAEVSTKHANFIQVDAGGRAADVAALMATVADRVLHHSGVRLHPETRLIGFTERERQEEQ